MTDKNLAFLMVIGGIALLLIRERADWLPVLLPLAALLALAGQWVGRKATRGTSGLK